MTSTSNNKGLKKSRTCQGMAGTVVPLGHAQHGPLSQMSAGDLFTCSGCKEHGAGKRFVCPHCDHQLHYFCANAPATFAAHPLHCHHILFLFTKPTNKGGSRCDVCHKACKGYAFRCNACAFQMHPCCAILAPEIVLPLLHPHALRLLPAEASPSLWCAECNRKRSGRVYHCSVCDYHVHAVCAKSAVNGLRENGFKDQDNKPNNMLGSAARLASQVMIDFIGGLIEGIAEGVGQVIAQDALKGRSSTSDSTSATNKSSRKNEKSNKEQRNV